jgi:hypothetical protein
MGAHKHHDLDKFHLPSLLVRPAPREQLKRGLSVIRMRWESGQSRHNWRVRGG